MTRKKAVLLGMALISLAALGVVAPKIYSVHRLFLEGGLAGCEESVLDQQRSPSGRYVALLTSGSCGATTSDVTRVKLDVGARDRNGQLADGDTVFQIESAAAVGVLWKSDSELRIEYATGVRPWGQTTWRDISIMAEKKIPSPSRTD